ncbi:MAG: RraA family protein [Alphaproteobacteria bacterium]|nr:RraA family protein [Alphaproteobacteria bacterium]
MTIDAALVRQARERLYTGVISDVLDGLGAPEHAMKPHVRPLDESLVVCGPARTALYMEVFHVEPGINPYELEIRLIDDLKPGEVAVMACPRGGRVAPWGELLSTASKARGAAGCVTDGLVRDVKLIREMKFPVFAGGIGPLDSKGRGVVMMIDVPIVCGGTAVNPGDWIFGDVDGVCVIPAGLASETFRRSLAKVEAENTVRRELERGDKLADVFKRHGIL